MNLEMKAILESYTIEELVKIMDEECEALGIECIDNGCETEFEDIVLPAISGMERAFTECYTIDTTNVKPCEKEQTYSYLTKKRDCAYLGWKFTENFSANCTDSTLQLAA